MKGVIYINLFKRAVSNFFEEYISNTIGVLFSILSTYIWKLIHEFLVQTGSNKKVLYAFLKPITKFLFIASIVVCIIFVLKLCISWIVSKRHRKNLISRPSYFEVLYEPDKKSLYSGKSSKIQFLVGHYNTSKGIDEYVKIDKVICRDCNGVIDEVKKTLFGNFIFRCNVCGYSFKDKINLYTMKRNFEEILNASIRTEYYNKSSKFIDK